MFVILRLKQLDLEKIELFTLYKHFNNTIFVYELIVFDTLAILDN